MLGENRSERAVLIVDLVNEFSIEKSSNFIPQIKEIIPFIFGELQYFRERMRPVIFANTCWPESRPSQAESVFLRSQVVRELTPRTGEIIINKSRPNAFFASELFAVLTQLKVKNLTIVGAPAHTSVLLTAAAALDHGFSVVVPETCICSHNPLDQEAALRLINRWLVNDQMLPK